jgi:hypothetical protein
MISRRSTGEWVALEIQFTVNDISIFQLVRDHKPASKAISHCARMLRLLDRPGADSRRYPGPYNYLLAFKGGNGMNDRAKSILLALENIREDLLGLSDDIWLDVDHNDTEKVREACDFKSQFNDQLQKFSDVSRTLEKLIGGYTGTPKTDLTSVQESEAPTIESSEPEQQGHSLDRSFTYTRPNGYLLDGRKYKGVKNWVRLYLSVCEQLQKRNPETFRNLASSEEMITSHGNKMFSFDGSDLRDAKEISGGIFAEGNLSADQMRDTLKKVLPEFEIEPSSFRVFLRYDPQATPAYDIENIEDLF